MLRTGEMIENLHSYNLGQVMWVEDGRRKQTYQWFFIFFCVCMTNPCTFLRIFYIFAPNYSHESCYNNIA
jgi:hypothetical protein